MIQTAEKVFYAMVGAPVVAYDRTMAMSGKFVEFARTDYEDAVKEGEKVAHKVRTTNLADEIGSRVDLETMQNRVEKLRDQLEDALAQWRENFTPGDAEAVSKPAPAAKPAAKKPAAKTTAAKKPATKKPAAKASAAKKPATKTPVEDAS